MKKKYLIIFLLTLCLLAPSILLSEEIKYSFTQGATYSYKYDFQSTSKTLAPPIVPKQASNKRSIDFKIKSLGFQDGAFILDIGADNQTHRRYIAPNGALVGSPSEDRSHMPFFPVFPNKDWRIGSYSKESTEIVAFGQKIPVVWNLKLNHVDSIKNLADINFEAQFKFSDDRLFSRKLTLNGKIIFNMSEGVIHKAEWNSTYTAKHSCKEIAITRELWSFEKKASHSLVITGVEK